MLKRDGYGFCAAPQKYLVENCSGHALGKSCYLFLKKEKESVWYTKELLGLQIRYSPESIQRTVAWTAYRTLGRERELELDQPRVECECQLGWEPERVEWR